MIAKFKKWWDEQRKKRCDHNFDPVIKRQLIPGLIGVYSPNAIINETWDDNLCCSKCGFSKANKNKTSRPPMPPADE
jgi:hypothetical protein